MTSEMEKFVCQYNFLIALTKVNLKNVPQGPLTSHKYIHVSRKPGFYFTDFLVYFLKPVYQGFYMKHNQF